MGKLLMNDTPHFREKSRLLSTVRGVFSYTRIFSTAPIDSISEFRYNWDTYLHCSRVQDKASLFFSTLMFTDFDEGRLDCGEEIRNFLYHFSYHIISQGFFLHDLGKPFVLNSDIFDKDMVLTKEDRDSVQTHPLVGESIIRSMRERERRIFKEPDLQELAESSYNTLRNIILYHHERYDGDGYPDGKSGEDIPFEARVASIIDVHDALSNPRFYKEAWPREKVIGFFQEERGKSFDPNLVDFVFRKGSSIGGHSLFDIFCRIDEFNSISIIETQSC